MSNSLLLLRAQTALHPGEGTSVGAIDLPVQREQTTGWPQVQGSTMKGLLREGARQTVMQTDPQNYPTAQQADAHPDVEAMFGPSRTPDFGGALGPTDARILAFPVRSARHVFCWVTCLRVLERLRDDFALAALPVPSFLSGNLAGPAAEQAAVSDDAVGPLLVSLQNGQPNTSLFLEDLIFQRTTTAAANTLAGEFAQWLETYLCDAALRPKTRCAVIPDDAFTHLVRYATEIATRIRLDPETKHVQKGALFTVELLPPETLLYSVLMTDTPRGGASNLTRADMVTRLRAQTDNKLLQVGGEETTGKGWCRARLYPPAPSSAPLALPPSAPSSPAPSPSAPAAGGPR